MSGANLSGADLRDTKIIRVNVTEAKFVLGIGLSREMKEELQQQGAIIEEMPKEPYASRLLSLM